MQQGGTSTPPCRHRRRCDRRLTASGGGGGRHDSGDGVRRRDHVGVVRARFGWPPGLSAPPLPCRHPRLTRGVPPLLPRVPPLPLPLPLPPRRWRPAVVNHSHRRRGGRCSPPLRMWLLRPQNSRRQDGSVQVSAAELLGEDTAAFCAPWLWAPRGCRLWPTRGALASSAVGMHPPHRWGGAGGAYRRCPRDSVCGFGRRLRRRCDVLLLLVRARPCVGTDVCVCVLAH